MEEIVFVYKKKKMFANLIVLILTVIIISTSIMSLMQPNILTYIAYTLINIVIISYLIYRIVRLKELDYFIRCTKEGIYTNESFAYCDWKHIQTIEWKRYMGYRTLFFQINEEIKSKLSPIIRNGKQYYYLPLADCKEKPQVILEKLNNFKNN